MNESGSSDENEGNLEEKHDADYYHGSYLLHQTRNGLKYRKRIIGKDIRDVRYNRTKDPENYFREQPMLFTPWRNE